MEQKAIVEIYLEKYDKNIDMEIPLNISVYELVKALNQVFNLGINMNNITQIYIRTEHPIGLFKAMQKLDTCGIMNGTIIRI